MLRRALGLEYWKAAQVYDHLILQGAAVPEKAPTHLKPASLVTVVSVVVLVGVEVLAVAIAAGWAIAGLFQLGRTIEYAFMVVFSLLAIWAIVRFARSAAKVEPLYGADD
jgi:hypothetical protein